VSRAPQTDHRPTITTFCVCAQQIRIRMATTRPQHIKCIWRDFWRRRCGAAIIARGPRVRFPGMVARPGDSNECVNNKNRKWAIESCWHELHTAQFWIFKPGFESQNMQNIYGCAVRLYLHLDGFRSFLKKTRPEPQASFDRYLFFRSLNSTLQTIFMKLRLKKIKNWSHERIYRSLRAGRA